MNRKALEINPKHTNSQFNIAVVYHKPTSRLDIPSGAQATERLAEDPL
jgi:hypothetical protein